MSDDPGSVTIHLQNRFDPNLRNDAFRAIHEFLKGRFRTKGILDAKVGARVGDSDVYQEAFWAFAQTSLTFANRSAFGGWFVETWQNKAKNLRRTHHQQKRDVRREVPPASVAGDESRCEVNVLDQGKRILLPNPPDRGPHDSHIGDLPNCEADSFFDGDCLHQMFYDDQPLDVVLCRDSWEFLEAFDEKSGDCLSEIALYLLEGRDAEEIATLLKGRRLSKRSVERRRQQIMELWGLTRVVYVSVPEPSGSRRVSPRAIHPSVSAAQLLARLRVHDCYLVRVACGSRPEHRFSKTDNLYDFIEDGDTLEARSSER